MGDLGTESKVTHFTPKGLPVNLCCYLFVMILPLVGALMPHRTLKACDVPLPVDAPLFRLPPFVVHRPPRRSREPMRRR